MDLPPSVAPLSADILLAAALRAHHANELNEAEALYRSILTLPSPHAAAYYGLGLLCYLQGNFAAAADAFRRTVALRPDDAEALTNLGTALLALGDPAAAVEHYRHAIAIKPSFALVHANLGKALRDQGHLADAVVAYTRAADLGPDNALVHANLAGVLLEQDQAAEAAAMAQRALALQPDMAMACANLAVALFKLARRQEALDACRQAIALRPADARMQATLGGILLELGELEDAAAACRWAIALNPAIPMAHFNLAHACKGTNQLVEATAACRNAVALEPDLPDYHFLLAHLLLVQGDFDAGWKEYEWRLKRADFAWFSAFRAEFGQPQWQGEDLADKTIFLLPEQGLGDNILFVRFGLLLAARGARVIIGVHQPMHRLFASLPTVAVLPVSQRPLPDFDLYCPLVNLPRLCGVPDPAVFSVTPYLCADPSLRTRWRQRLGSARPRVGVVWGGNPLTKYDGFRSPRLAPMRALFDLPGISFVVLQVGPAREDLATMPLPSHVLDLGPELDDLATTAAIMAELDLVISSCTAPLHLAGALGVPTWGLLPFAPYFPWLLERADTAWYPSMRLYRQHQPGADWSGVVAQVAHDLLGLAATWPARDLVQHRL